MTAASSIPTMAWTYLMDIVFDEDAGASQLFTIVLFFAILWFSFFYVAKAVIRKLTHNKKWLLDALERDYERSGKKMLVDLNINMTKEECIAWTLNDWPRLQCIYIQHFVGSLFCMPAILGIGDPSTSASLATLGILSEMGWEFQDIIEMIFVRTFCENGKEIWPDSIFAIWVVHHSLSTILGLPMVLFYRTHRSLQWLCFDLQFAAAVALMVAEYTKILDIAKPGNLRQFKFLNFVAFVVMLWTRVIHWAYLCFDFFITWYQDGAYWFLAVGLPVSMAFTAFSYLCCVKPYYKKFVKFLGVSAEYEALPPDATPEKRRASVIKLDEAVAELLDSDGVSELATIFENRTPSRRHSMPVQSRKRRSLLIPKRKSEFIPSKKDL